MIEHQTLHDLSATARALKGSGVHTKLINHINRAAQLLSALEDLERALLCLDLLTEMDEAECIRKAGARYDERSSAMRQALLTNAIILYSRSTTTKSDHRKQVDVLHALGDAARIAHKFVIDIRDSAVAHWGSGDKAGGKEIWARVVVVLRYWLRGAIGVQVSTDRLNSSGEVSAALRKVLPPTINRVKVLAKEHVDGILNELWSKPDLLQIVLQHRFNPDEYFGSAMSLAQFHAVASSFNEDTSDYLKKFTSNNPGAPLRRD